MSRWGARSLDMNVVSSTKAYQDGVPMDLFDSLRDARINLNRKRHKSIRVMCGVCDHPTGLLIYDQQGFQTSKCTNCSSVHKWHKTAWGRWKFKNSRGTWYVDDNGEYQRTVSI